MAGRFTEVFLILTILTLLVIYVYKRLMGKKMSYSIRMNEIYEYGVDGDIPEYELRESKKLDFSFLEDIAPKRLTSTIKMTGMNVTPGEYIFIWLVLLVVPASVFSILGSSFAIIMISLILGSLGPYFYLERAKVKARDRFDKQLADALDIIVNCLRIGLSFETALMNVAEDMPEPVSSEFDRVAQEISIGGDLVASLEGVADRMQSDYMILVSTAVIINKEAGGNLASVLGNIRDSIREGLRLRKHVRTLTAQGKLSAVVVSGVPVLIAVLFSIISPGYLDPFFEDFTGNLVFLSCIVLQVFGALWMADIVKLDF